MYACSQSRIRAMTACGARRSTTALLALALAGGCASARGELAGPRTEYGEAVRVGQGTARAYLVHEGPVPLELGIALSEGALRGLPTEQMGYEYRLPLPRGAAALPFHDVVLNWNPHGHVPPGVYDRPHFDLHFYTITDTERRQIVASDPQFEQRGARQPPPEYRPAGYILPPGTLEPAMGAHWIDPQSAEFQGRPFTRTFLFGSWDGRLTFYEPMITLAYLETRPDELIRIPVAARHEVRGYYPDAYRVQYDAAKREYRVGLSGLQMRP